MITMLTNFVYTLKFSRLGCGLLSALMLWGCSHSRSLVVLLPDSDGNVGAIQMQTAGGSYRVDKAYHAVQSDRSYKTPEPLKLMQKQQVREMFDDALAAQPAQRFGYGSFTLYCHRDSVELTTASQATVSGLIQTLKTTQPAEIYVIGHADRVGTEKYNSHLSNRRAVSIQRLLISKGISSKIIVISHLGESRPWIDTEDEVEEPLNRRIEIVTLNKKR